MARIDLYDTALTISNGAAFVDADLLFDLGMRAASGRDGAIDLVSAHMYFNLADHKGADRAAFYRQDVAEQMSKIEIGRALRAARDWLSAD